MRIHITTSRIKANNPSAGDLKTSRAGVFIRKQRKHRDCYIVSNGRPVWDWVWLRAAPGGFKGRAVIEYAK